VIRLGNSLSLLVAKQDFGLATVRVEYGLAHCREKASRRRNASG
jgi:hypothetical protein